MTFFWKINLDNDHSLGYFDLYSNYNEVSFFKEDFLSLSLCAHARACLCTCVILALLETSATGYTRYHYHIVMTYF